MSGTEMRRGLYDGEEEPQAPWFVRAAEDEDDEKRAAQAVDLAEWAAAERDQLCVLADTVRLLGRLEQALWPTGSYAGPTASRAAAARLALVEASDLLWLEGVRVRPERLWMHQADHAAAPVADRAEYALGLWIVARLTGAAQLDDEEGLRRFLGRRHNEQSNNELSALIQTPTAEESAAARADWLTAKKASAALHPLTQAAFLADQWRQMTPGGRESDLEAAVIAAKLAAEGGLPFVPLGLGAKRRIAGSGGRTGGAGAILARMLEAAQGGAQQALMQLARRDEWRSRAAAAPLKKNPAALIPLLDKEFVITTAAAEAHLGSVRQTALTSLNILRDHGLVREITGGKSYLYWTAEVNPDLVRRRR